MINKKLHKIRKKLDKLDDKFLLLIKKRTLLVNQVLLTKNLKIKLLTKIELDKFYQILKPNLKEKI